MTVEDLTAGNGRILVEYVQDTFILPTSFRPLDATPHIIQWSVAVARQINPLNQSNRRRSRLCKR